MKSIDPEVEEITSIYSTTIIEDKDVIPEKFTGWGQEPFSADISKFTGGFSSEQDRLDALEFIRSPTKEKFLKLNKK